MNSFVQIHVQFYLIKTSQLSCSSCHSHCIKLTSEANRKQANLDKPAKLYAPVTHTNPVRLKLALQEHRLQCKQLESELVIMKTALELNSEKVSPELSADFVSLFCGCDQTDVPPFMKLFWEEQQKYVQSSSKSSIRYHPMIIKYCLNLAAKSSSTYSDLRYDSKSGSGILLLPSLRTLRDYKNYIKPTRGFNPAVIKELATKTSSFQPMERFVSIIFDEMKIQEDLVWDKYSGELIGFVDLGDIHTNFALFLMTMIPTIDGWCFPEVHSRGILNCFYPFTQNVLSPIHSHFLCWH